MTAPAVRCDQCGQLMLDANLHIRSCPNQDPVELARLILDGGAYLDAHAEVVARAFLEGQR